MAEQFVNLLDRGVTLCTERAGTGPALLVITGTGSDLRNHPNPHRWPIAKHFDTVAYDHRCLGQSEQHDPDHQPTMADYGADALALCDDQGFQEFSVIGVSFGGMVAQELATIAGTRLTRLVLCCTSSGGEGDSSYPLHELYAAGKSMDDLADVWDTRTTHDELVAAQMGAILGGRRRPTLTPPGLLKQLEARRHHDTWDRLPRIECETLVASGMYDGVAPAENSERLAAQIPRTELVSFPAGHMLLAQDPSAWPTILEFLLR
jgi:3-oxoadipate enol-lactonase